MADFANTSRLERRLISPKCNWSQSVGIPFLFILLLSMELGSAELAATRHYIAGLEYGSHGSFVEARRELQKAKQFDGSHEEVYAILDVIDRVSNKKVDKGGARHLFKGMLLRDQGDLGSAIRELDQAIEIDPNFEEFYYFRGLAQEASGRYSAAMQDYSTALRLKRGHCEALYRRGVLHIHNGRYDEAIADFNAVIGLHPDYGDAYFMRGNAHHKKGQYDNAIADYTKVLSIRPADAQAYYNRGNTYEKLRRHTQAIHDFTKALEYDLGEWQAEGLRGRGVAYVYTGQVDRAISDLNKLIELRPADAHGYISRGIAFMVSGHRRRACSEWKKACDLGECRYLNQTRYSSGC